MIKLNVNEINPCTLTSPNEPPMKSKGVPAMYHDLMSSPVAVLIELGSNWNLCPFPNCGGNSEPRYVT